MKLHEYQAKKIFRQYNIPTPDGVVCSSAEEAAVQVRQFRGAAIKAQVLVGGRGKAGGIAMAEPENAEDVANRILDLTIKDLPVRKVLVEQRMDIGQEFYLSIALDRNSRRPLLIISASGGVDIEEVARTSPHRIHKESIDPFLGPEPDQWVQVSRHLGIADTTSLSAIIANLYRLYDDLDCLLAEINPLVLTNDGSLVALDAKINIDENALFRQPAMQVLYETNLDDLEPREVEARKLGMSYVALDGRIGCIVNGAGLALATLDMITAAGGKAANFMDVRGGADAFHVGRAVEITASNPNTDVLLINMFGGLTRCDEIAEGIKNNLQALDMPVVIRLTGTNQEQGWKILEGAHVTVAQSTADAARIAVGMVS